MLGKVFRLLQWTGRSAASKIVTLADFVFPASTAQTQLAPTAYRASILHQMLEVRVELIGASELSVWVSVNVTVSMLAIWSRLLKPRVAVGQSVESVDDIWLGLINLLVDPFLGCDLLLEVFIVSLIAMLWPFPSVAVRSWVDL